MKTKIYYLFTLFFSFFVSSCIYVGPSITGNGNISEEERPVSYFNTIKVSSGINVYLSQGDNEKISVKADENLLDIIKTEIENEELKIYASEQIRHSKSKKVYVTVNDIEKISTSSGSNLYTETDIKSNNLDLSSSSGSNMKLNVETNFIDASASSGANLMIEGITRDIEMDVSSGANIKAEDLIATICKAKASSGANAWITVKEKLNGEASSGGNVFYLGNPDKIQVNNSSGGNVHKR